MSGKEGMEHSTAGERKVKAKLGDEESKEGLRELSEGLKESR